MRLVIFTEEIVNSLNRNNTQFIILVGIVTALLLFQNCAKQFSSQCSADCEEWRSVVAAIDEADEYQKVSFYDEKQFEILSKSPELVAHNKNAVALNLAKTKFFGEEFSAVVHIPAQFQGKVFSIQSENSDAEAARMIVEGNFIYFEHASSKDDYYRIVFAIPPGPKDLILGVFFGIRVLDIRFVANGKLILTDNGSFKTELRGAPVNYSYLEKNLLVSDQAVETMIFNRKLSTYELASVSRQIANMNSFTNVAYDDTIKIDSDVNFIQERSQFLAARQILKSNNCFKCHGSWVNYGEYNYIASGLIKENSAANSPLWTRLAGTLELNKQNKKKDMPLKQTPLKNEELDILKAWIMSFTSG